MHSESELKSEAEVGVLTYEEGLEFAPDSPWGLERLSFDQRGGVSYVRRRAGHDVGVLAGTVDVARISAVLDALARSTFPVVPAHKWPPGPSAVTIEIASGRASLGFDFGLGLEGYGDALAEMSEIMSDMRAAFDEQVCTSEPA